MISFITTLPLTPEERRRLRPSADLFRKLLTPSETGNRFFPLKLWPGSSACINKQSSVALPPLCGVPVYAHREPGSVLRGFKYLAVAATALNVREVHDTSDPTPALQRYPQAELQPWGWSTPQPPPSTSAEGDTKSSDKDNLLFKPELFQIPCF